jgi:hypothetical protein
MFTVLKMKNQTQNLIFFVQFTRNLKWREAQWERLQSWNAWWATVNPINMKVILRKKNLKCNRKYQARNFQISTQSRKCLRSTNISKTISLHMRINAYWYITKSWRKYFNAIIITKESTELTRKYLRCVNKIKTLW